MGRGYSRRATRPDELTDERAEELGKCFHSAMYFIRRYCKIYDSVEMGWIDFDLWPAQRQVLKDIHANKLTVILKARQLGISWLSLCYALWTMMFRPISVVSIFSRRENEAAYLMSEERLRGIYNNLPLWMRSGYEPKVDSVKEWILANDSACRAFPTSAGDGYVATLAIVDEADLAPDLNLLLGAVKPTIDNGGKLILLSRSNKQEPESEFKAIYRGAREGKNPWKHVFLPWSAHPARTPEWYAEQSRDFLSRTGSLDGLYEQYPETDDQALAAATLDKRISPIWLERVFSEMEPIRVKDAPALPNLLIYHAPVPGSRYVVGADPAEGNPTSDDSSLTVVDVLTGRESAVLFGKYEPAIFADYVAQVSAFYNHAPVMVERNNHGHSVIQWLEEHSRRTRLLYGHDAETHRTDKKSRKRRKHLKFGWLSSKLGKTILYNLCTNHVRFCARVDESEEAVKIIHNRTTFTQLGSIEAASLSAPKGQHDDRADSFALAQAGRVQIEQRGQAVVLVAESATGWGF